MRRAGHLGTLTRILASVFCTALLLLSATAAHAQKNQPPTVTLTSPLNGASFIAPATVSLAATASDPNGTVVRVDFFQGSTLIGTSTTPPYAATWSNVAAGSYTLTAKAIDNQGATGTSAPVSITVASATSLVITSPADGSAVSISSALPVSGTYEGPATGNTILIDDEAKSVLALISGNSYSATLSPGGLAIGANTLTVRLNRADRSHVTRSITVFGYSAPVVAFTAPASATFDAPATVTFGVDAKAPGGTVTKVEFFRGGTLVGTVTAPPYQVTLNDLAVGSYTITAQATSSHGPIGGASTSIQVLGPNTPPSISITSPAAGATFTAPVNIPIAVNATDPDGTVTLVEYFANAAAIGASNVPPFALTWPNVPAGSYALTARATDDRNGQTTSAPVNISVNQPPTVSLTAPAAGATFTAPATITLTATASDGDGTISTVEFYHGATLIGAATAPPYTLNWNAVVSGSLTLTAKAIDNLGAATASAPVTITVNGAVTFLHNDFAGNPLAATDGTGAILWKENFRPYGDRLNNQPAAGGNRQWFHGKAVDVDTGLSYFGARYYDATLGRFMGIDPKGFSESSLASFNRYAYGNNNPYKYLDPNGEEAFEVNALFIGVTAGIDASTGQPFWKARLGLTGAGLFFYPDYDFSIDGKSTGVGDCAACAARADSSGANVSLGAKVGLGPLLQLKGNLVEYQKQVINIEGSNGQISTQVSEKPLQFFTGSAKIGYSGKDKEKPERRDSGRGGIGVKLSADANAEWGAVIPWSTNNSNVKSHRDPNF